MVYKGGGANHSAGDEVGATGNRGPDGDAVEGVNGESGGCSRESDNGGSNAEQWKEIYSDLLFSPGLCTYSAPEVRCQ